MGDSVQENDKGITVHKTNAPDTVLDNKINKVSFWMNSKEDILESDITGRACYINHVMLTSDYVIPSWSHLIIGRNELLSKRPIREQSKCFQDRFEL